MNRDYKRWYSPTLEREMELLVLGHGGRALLTFPTSMGRFFEFEDRGMASALAGPLEAGNLTIFCLDSVDSESWYNKSAHPRARVQRHMEYERYVLDEVLPLVHHLRGPARIAVTGCSFGGYHAANFAFKHPELVSRCVSMGGAFDIRQYGWNSSQTSPEQQSRRFSRSWRS